MRLVLLASTVLCLAACAEPAPPAPAQPQPTVLDDQLRTRDRAQQVEDDLIKQQQEQDKAMEEQGG